MSCPLNDKLAANANRLALAQQGHCYNKNTFESKQPEEKLLHPVG